MASTVSGKQIASHGFGSLTLHSLPSHRIFSAAGKQMTSNSVHPSRSREGLNRPDAKRMPGVEEPAGGRETVPSATLGVVRSIVHTARFFALIVAALLVTAGSAFAEGRVYSSAEAVKPLAPGATVPSAQVESLDGDPVDLAELVRDRGALLVFYRGGW